MNKVEKIVETLKAEKDVKETQLIEIQEEFGGTNTPPYGEQEKVIERYAKAISILERIDKENIKENVIRRVPVEMKGKKSRQWIANKIGEEVFNYLLGGKR